MIKIKDARISILINQDRTTIEIKDRNANTTIVHVELTPLQLSAALSRLVEVECNATVYELEKIGKQHENKFFEFELPFASRDIELLHSTAIQNAPEGWIPDKYYSSQNSFFQKNGKQYARVVIRRWL